MSKGKRKAVQWAFDPMYEIYPMHNTSQDPRLWQPIYEPLPAGDNLRILILQPGEPCDDIACNLKVQTLRRSKNEYAAISYVWGDPDDTVYINCNGWHVPITRNLADALRQFRHPRTIRRLWADALCINQGDVKEKGVQVGKMGKIFRNAMKVLVWLGRDLDAIADDCFHMIKHTNEYLDDIFCKNGQSFSTMPRLMAPFPIQVDRESWSRIRKLMQCSWFFRTWTVQECALAKQCQMYWGASHIDVADVFEISLWAASHVDLRMTLLGYGMQVCGNLLYDFQNIHCHYKGRNQWQSSRPGLSLESFSRFQGSLSGVLFSGRFLETTDPRDHVFAFLECPYAKDENGKPILKADYSASMEEVCYQVACALVRNSREGRWLLSAVKHEDRGVITDLTRPSWVPYWHESHKARILAKPQRDYLAGGIHSLFAAKPRRGRALEISGFIFDSVVWSSDDLGVNGFTLQAFQNAKTYIAAEPLVESLWREASLAAEKFGAVLDEDAFTMTLLTHQDNPASSFWMQRHRETFQAYCEISRSDYKSGTSAGSQGSVDASKLSVAIDVMGSLNVSAGRRKLFLTRSGRVGLASPLVEVGDLCSIFAGVTVPFLLSPATSRWHRLVDECYIFGAMHGQLMDMYPTEPIFLV